MESKGSFRVLLALPTFLVSVIMYSVLKFGINFNVFVRKVVTEVKVSSIVVNLLLNKMRSKP